MSESKLDGIYNLTSPAVLMFPNLLEPKPYVENGIAKGEPKFSATLVFTGDHPDLKGMKEKVALLARAQWPDKPFSELCFPFRAGDKSADKRKAKGKDDAEHLRGQVVMKTSSKFEPRLAYFEGGKIIDLETLIAKQAAKNRFFNGAEVLATINFVAYEAKGESSKGGVTAYLNVILATGKGNRLTGGATASEVFKGYIGSVSAVDPTGGDSLDDVIGI